MSSANNKTRTVIGFVPLKEHFCKQKKIHEEFECFLFTKLSDLKGDKVSQFLSSKCKGAYGVWGWGTGENRYIFSIGNLIVKRHISF